MLVLTRKVDESIRIRDNKITVLEIRGDKVLIGIEAPREVPVHREEVYQQIHGGVERVASRVEPPGAASGPSTLNAQR